MYDLIVCRCGNSIGQLFPLFKKLKAMKFIKQFKERFPDDDINTRFPTNDSIYSYIAMYSDIEFSVGDILDALCVNNMCCRTVMMTNEEIKNYK